jgi:hypothetical protein
MKSICAISAAAMVAAWAQSFAQNTLPASATLHAKASTTISTTFTVKSAQTAGPVTLNYNSGGVTKPLELPGGTRIENLKVDAATVKSGSVAGGTYPPSATVDLQAGTVTLPTLTRTTLKGATLQVTTINPNEQTVTVRGAAYKGAFTFTAPQGFLLTAVEAADVTISNVEVPAGAVQQQRAKPATSTTVDVTTEGDFFRFNTKVENFAPAHANQPGTITVPRDTCFRVTKEFDREDPADTSRTQKYVTGTFQTGFWANFPGPPLWGCLNRDELVAAGLDPDLSYDVLRQTIVVDRDRHRYGWTYGLFVAPFKYYPHDRSLNAGATVGPYLGYRYLDRPGGSAIVGASVGLTSATVTTTGPDGQSTSTERTGITFALGYLIEIKRDFNSGVLIGWDHFAKSYGVERSGEIWFGISLGRKLD